MSSQEKPLIHVQQAACSRMLRSPSHESISTEVSLLSLASLGPFARIASPIPDHCSRLRVPSATGGDGTAKSPTLEMDDENDFIKHFGFLFKLPHLSKSFSTSDISVRYREPLRKAVSELDFTNEELEVQTHFGLHSRSCSTWVACGDVSASQLPSPQGRPHLAPNGGSFTAADLVRSVNKKIRQMYFRKRLLTALRALHNRDNLDLDLDKLPVPAKFLPPRKVDPVVVKKSEGEAKETSKEKKAKEIPVTIKDVERERGRPLSKFERNMMIFNWLHSLEDNFTPVVE